VRPHDGFEHENSQFGYDGRAGNRVSERSLR
jgi:hypothetical protein